VALDYLFLHCFPPGFFLIKGVTGRLLDTGPTCSLSGISVSLLAGKPSQQGLLIMYPAYPSLIMYICSLMFQDAWLVVLAGGRLAFKTHIAFLLTRETTT
jgi:hypothetical protein